MSRLINLCSVSSSARTPPGTLKFDIVELLTGQKDGTQMTLISRRPLRRPQP